MRAYQQGDLESPFLKDELFIGETGAGLEPRLAALEAESPFQHAIEESSESAVEPELYEVESEGEESLDDSSLEYLNEPEQEELFLETETPYAEGEQLSSELDHDQDEGGDEWTVPRPQVNALETVTSGPSPKVGYLADREAVRVDEESEQIAAELERIASHSGFLGEPQMETQLGAIVPGLGSIFALGPPSAAADPSVAVPPFNFGKRLLLPVSVLDAAQNTSAIRWNQRQHPRVSGVDPSDIRIDLQRYVNLTAIQAAINRFNQANPSAQIAVGTPPIDAVFVEAVHQFQVKCFFETSQIDGLAGESTLDSLGLVRRSGLNTADKPNTGAVKRLKRVDVPTETGGKEFSASSWFDSMVNPTFLGWRFTTHGAVRGVHLFLMRKFRIAEKALLAQSTYRGMTPVELGKALGFNDKSEEHRGARPDATTASMHTYGLAVDIKYSQNPWVRGPNFMNTLKRAALLISGEQVTQATQATSEQFFHSLGADPKLTTEQIFEILSQRDRDFRHYLRLHNNPTELKNVLNQRRADGTTGVFDPSAETLDQAVRRWQPLIIKDRTNMRDPKNSPFLMNGRLREPDNGFLNLNKDLVVALRDKACLAWGAVDLGPGSDGSGDVMHFDARVCGLGDRLAVGTNFRVTSGHPCLPCPAAGGSSAATTGELEAEEEFYSEDVTYLEREPLTPTEAWIESEEEQETYPQEEATYIEEAIDEEPFVEPEEKEIDWETFELEQSPAILAGVAEFAVTLGKEWAKRRNGSPPAEKITEWLLQDYQDTLEGARRRSKRIQRRYPGDDSIGRAWMISRQEQMNFQTSASADVKALQEFQAPADSVALVSNKSLIEQSDKYPVAPLVIRFVQELRQRYRGPWDAKTYSGHGLGTFKDRGYSIDLYLQGKEDRGFYPTEEAVKFLRALHEAARATKADWRVIYNDFSVADTINRETGQKHVIFVGTVRRDKTKKITSLNWHGPHPLILHFHLDLVPRASASNVKR